MPLFIASYVYTRGEDVRGRQLGSHGSPHDIYPCRPLEFVTQKHYGVLYLFECIYVVCSAFSVVTSALSRLPWYDATSY